MTGNNLTENLTAALVMTGNNLTENLTAALVASCHKLLSFSTSTLTPSYSFTQEPRRVQYNPCNKNTINKIRIYITDGKRRIIDLNHSDTSFSLILREKRD